MPIQEWEKESEELRRPFQQLRENYLELAKKSSSDLTPLQFAYEVLNLTVRIILDLAPTSEQGRIYIKKFTCSAVKEYYEEKEDE